MSVRARRSSYLAALLLAACARETQPSQPGAEGSPSGSAVAAEAASTSDAGPSTRDNGAALADAEALSCNESGSEDATLGPLATGKDSDGERPEEFEQWLEEVERRLESDPTLPVLAPRRPANPDPEKVVCWQQTPSRGQARALQKLAREQLVDRRPPRLDELEDDRWLWCTFGSKSYPISAKPGSTIASFAAGGDSSPTADGCYAACGSGCEGACKRIPVGCAAPDGDNQSKAFACLSLRDPNSGRRPWRPGSKVPQCVAPREHALGAGACGAGAHPFVPAGLTETKSWVQACTTETCCGRHDECNRYHSWHSRAGAKCQLKGLKTCGLWAWWYGRPKVPWTLRLYDQTGRPITGRHWDGNPLEIGTCSWSGGHPIWQGPATQADEYPCLVDDQMHSQDPP
jgi:hypothetical protein